jgi:V/A-type H+-transporting ATPase subunit E
MKSLEQGPDKVKKITELLKSEVIAPAKKEGEQIIAEAQKRAEEIEAKAAEHAEKLLADARAAIEQERNIFHSSLQQASQQSIAALKQAIEEQLFRKDFQEMIKLDTSQPQTVAGFIRAIIQAIQKEGLSTDVSALIPKHLPVAEINSLLGDNFVKKLKEQSVVVGDFGGGVQIKLHDKKITIDLTDQALFELLKRYYTRKDFYKFVFGNAG